MRSLKCALACMTAFAALNVQAQRVSPPALFHGTGRACYGSLVIRPHTITWNTPFSQCQAASYSITEHSDSSGHSRDTYLLKKTNKACRFRVLSLTHADDRSPDIGWEVSAYGNEGTYITDKASGYTASTPDMMSCYLVRVIRRQGGPSSNNLPN